MSAYVPAPYNAVNFDSQAVVYIPAAYNAVNFDIGAVSIQSMPWLYFFAVTPQ
jgi:hypothetical protein